MTKPLSFRRIAIVNRGEPAVRLIHAVRELNEEHGWDLRTIALYTEPDRRALFVREADERYFLGPAFFVDPADGERKNAYLNYAGLEAALVATGAEAVWVGWGFVAEHAAFVDVCDRLGIEFVGPSADVMRNMGDKIASKRLAEAASVPVTPWSGGPVSSVEEAERVCDRLGYPVMIKATAGGGGRGIRRVRGPEDLPERLESARSEALKAFGDATVFIETMVTGARHIEVQIIADKHGTAWAVGVRDCTVQRRNQKVIEEAPSPVLTEDEDREVREAAERLAKHAGYYNAGTVECLFDPDARKFYFMEMNTRLQVEHPVTEQTTGLDLVKMQLHVASGARLEGEPPPRLGHAVEMRLTAEDPDAGFAPAPGLVAQFDVPLGPGIRVDSGVSQGDMIASEFDSMIAKIIAHGKTRGEALGRLRRALLESSIVIQGGSSNKAFLLELLSHPKVIASDYDIGWLDQLTENRGPPDRPLADVALVRAAIDVYDEELRVETRRFFAGAARGRPTVRPEIGFEARLSYGGQTYELVAQQLGPDRYRVVIDGGERVEAHLDRFGDFGGFITVGGRRHRVLAMVDGPTHLVEVDGMPYRISRDEGGVVRSPAPAVVIGIRVEPGQRVEAGDPLLVLEAMKMELELHAPITGRVRSVDVLKSQQVGAGQALLAVEAEEGGEAGATQARVRFSTGDDHDGDASPRERSRRVLDEMRRLVLGYDVDESAAKALRARRAEAEQALSPDDPELLRDEEEVIGAFADLLPLFRSESGDDPAAAEEYLQTYLRSPDAADRLPGAFRDRLGDALRHYGVEALERSDELENALLFLYKARARLARSAEQIFDLLERRLRHAEALRGCATPELRALLERLIEETPNRFLALHDIARKTQYVLYDRPRFEEAREAVSRTMQAHFADLVSGGPPAEGAMQELIDCPQPVLTILADNLLAVGEPRRRAVELAVRRYYRAPGIERLSLDEAHPAVGAVHATLVEPGPEPAHVLAAGGSLEELGAALSAVGEMAGAMDPEERAVGEIYLADPSRCDPDALSGQIQAAMSGAALPANLARITVVVPATGSDRRGIHSMTFAAREGGPEEVEDFRGVHPMVARRLELGRLRKFRTQKLRVSDDVFLFHAVARDNPKDERLIGFVEVRDMTPVHDDHGEIIALPALERLYLDVLADIRAFQARREDRRRLHWNRVVLLVRPPVALPMAPIQRIAERLQPAGAKLGLDRVEVHLRLEDPATGRAEPRVVTIANRSGTGLEVQVGPPDGAVIEPLDPYEQKVLRLRRLGLAYPYEITRLMTPPKDGLGSTGFPPGVFQEHDLDDDGALVPVDRPPGRNQANVVLGVITNYTAKHPEGLTRVICLGDGSRSMGSLAEPECRRINRGLDLAEEMGVPFEWFAVSSGAKISMEVGTEGLDWVARVLRRLIEFTQAGGEVNIVIPGVNVGGQSYWNAEATMLMHTRGILIMTPTASMVLTGKKALDHSGGVSAEDNLGIGGLDRIMGPNGQAQYAAKDVNEACQILLRYYDHSYVVPGERWPRRAPTKDPTDRDVRSVPHPPMDGVDFATIGEIFSRETNPDRKRSFDIRSVMAAAIDADHPPLERWKMMRDGETAVVWDAHLGGIPLTFIGMESRPVPRLGFAPGDGPEAWTGGTLFPKSSKKVARAINAASGNRPVVMLANLSGFDGSPESMREWQLEYGAEIGRAVVNFDGPIVFCVVSRYHGGAYVVFSCTLNENLRVAAIEGSYASVIGGGPAAAVVFPREVSARTLADPRVAEAQAQVDAAEDDVARARARAAYGRVYEEVHAEKQTEMAAYFDSVHSVQRARDVGSIHDIIEPAALRSWLVSSVEEGMRRAEAASTGD